MFFWATRRLPKRVRPERWSYLTQGRHMNDGNAGVLAARVDLGAARMLGADLAGAEEALAPVFILEPKWRTEALCNRITKLGRMLRTARYRGAAEASRIGEAIDNFTARRIPRSTTRAFINSAG
jgi:hypothetical protein